MSGLAFRNPLERLATLLRIDPAVLVRTGVSLAVIRLLAWLGSIVLGLVSRRVVALVDDRDDRRISAREKRGQTIARLQPHSLHRYRPAAGRRRHPGPGHLVRGPEPGEGHHLRGVESMTTTQMVIRTLIRTQPGEQWAAAGEFRRRMKIRIDREGMRVP